MALVDDVEEDVRGVVAVREVAEVLFFDEPIEERERHEALLDALVRSGLSIDGIDPGMRGVTRYGRMPFGVNTKKRHGPQGFPVRLVEWHPERRYSVEQIIKAYGLTLEKPRKFKAGPPPTAAAMTVAEREFADLLMGFQALDMYQREKRNGWHDVLCPWNHRHTTAPETGASLSAPCAENNWRGGFRCHHKCTEDIHAVRQFLFMQMVNRVRAQGGAK